MINIYMEIFLSWVEPRDFCYTSIEQFFSAIS